MGPKANKLLDGNFHDKRKPSSDVASEAGRFLEESRAGNG